MGKPQTFDERVAAFTEELTALSRRLDLVVGGCGCCGSPFVYDMREKDEARWVRDFAHGRYVYDLNGGSFLEWRPAH
jgi:hypothetical protein